MNEINGHAIAQAFYGAPMLEAEAKNRQGARADITEQIPQSERGKDCRNQRTERTKR